MEQIRAYSEASDQTDQKTKHIFAWQRKPISKLKKTYSFFHSFCVEKIEDPEKSILYLVQ